MVSDGGKNSDYFPDIPTPVNWEIESKEDHLTAIKLHFTTS